MPLTIFQIAALMRPENHPRLGTDVTLVRISDTHITNGSGVGLSFASTTLEGIEVPPSLMILPLPLARHLRDELARLIIER